MKVYIVKPNILKKSIIKTGKTYSQVSEDIGFTKCYLSQAIRREHLSSTSAKKISEYLKLDFEDVFGLEK